MSETALIGIGAVLMVPVLVAFDMWLGHRARKRADQRNQRNPPLVPDLPTIKPWPTIKP